MSDAGLLRQLSSDRAMASQLLFSHRHPQESPAFHVELIDLWRCADEFVLIEAFREAGKSTLSEEFLCLEGCFGNFRYCLLIGETYTKACQRLAAIAYEALHNVKLKRLFGTVLGKKPTENKLLFANNALIEAVGWEQELQSFKHMDARPDRAYLDDPENLERVRDKAAVDASMRKLYLELIPALDKTNRKIRITQTRRAEDCMVTRLAASPEWLYRAFPVCDGEPEDPRTKSIWPSRYPMEWIRAEMRRYRDAGMLAEFNQSYRLIVTDPATKPFKEEQLAYADVSPWTFMPRHVIYDPARTSDPTKSDRFGKVVVSRIGSRIYVHESSGTHLRPDEFIADVFATNARHKPVKIGIEKNSLDDWLLQPLRIAMLQRADFLPLTALNAPQDRSKEEFIMGLQPFAMAKDIVLVGGKLAHLQLVAEWCNFPSGPRDVLNALAYSMRMFGGIPVYEDFSGANVQEAPSVDQGEKVFVAWSADPLTCVAVAVIREGRRFAVAADAAATGAPRDAVAAIMADLRAALPSASFEHWTAADLCDQWQRVALVPALRAMGATPLRGPHIAVARGALAQPLRTVYRQSRGLTVDRHATLTLNALAGGYNFPVEKGGRQAREPEAGVSRLAGEALECLVYVLTQHEQANTIGEGANIAIAPSGQRYVTANPRAR